jgi:hypothetical protein
MCIRCTYKSPALVACRVLNSTRGTSSQSLSKEGRRAGRQAGRQAPSTIITIVLIFLLLYRGTLVAILSSPLSPPPESYRYPRVTCKEVLPRVPRVPRVPRPPFPRLRKPQRRSVGTVVTSCLLSSGKPNSPTGCCRTRRWLAGELDSKVGRFVRRLMHPSRNQSTNALEPVCSTEYLQVTSNSAATSRRWCFRLQFRVPFISLTRGTVASFTRLYIGSEIYHLGPPDP